MFVLGSGQVHHQDAEGERSSGSPEPVQPLLPVLLALGDTSDLQGRAKLVHPSGDHRRTAAG